MFSSAETCVKRNGRRLTFLLYGSGAGACVGWLGSWFREDDGAFFGGEIH
jgi:hypothetical protein